MPDELWTIRRGLQWTTGFFKDKGLDGPRLDAELLICDALSLDRIRLYTDHDRPLSSEELSGIRERVRRRSKHEPVAYITGKRGFWKHDLKVDRRVLIPRPDTERLVELALSLLAEGGPHRLVDVGTGSGAIALALAGDVDNLIVLAIDRSGGALEVARENARSLGLEDRVTFAEGDLLGPARDFGPTIIVSNPPYISTSEVDALMPDVLDFEPRLALDGGPDGLELVRRLIADAPALLPPGGHLLLEHGHDQGEAVLALVRADGRYEEARTEKDYGRRDRVMVARTRA